LHDIPLKALKAIAGSLKVPVEYGARIKLINAVDRAFWDGVLTERLIRELPEDRKRLLSLLAFSYDAGVHERALVRKMERLSGMNRHTVQEHINKLIPFALVGGIKETDNLYFCPKGIGEQVRKALIGNVVALSNSTDPLPSASSPDLLEDIFSFLAEAYKHTISLTLTGKIKKSFLERVFEGSATCTGHDLPLSEEHRNTFIIDYTRKRNLITFERRKARTTDKLSGWLRLSATKRLQDIVSFALARTLQDDYTITAFKGITGEIPAGASFDSSGLAYFLHAGTMATGGFSRIESRVREMLPILCHLGILSYKNSRFVMTVTSERFFQNVSLPLDEIMNDFFTVQPNFEIIVGPELNPLIRFKLELLSIRITRDIILTYKVTQEGITRARERGMSTGEILVFFDSHSRTPVPQNVRFSIENWAKAYGSIYFEQSTLMRFRDSSICSSVMHLPTIAPHIKEQLSDRALVISRDKIPMITETLKNAGYQPEVFGETPVDTILEEAIFNPVIPDDIMKEKSIPVVHSEFIFPDDLITNGDS